MCVREDIIASLYVDGNPHLRSIYPQLVPSVAVYALFTLSLEGCKETLIHETMKQFLEVEDPPLPSVLRQHPPFSLISQHSIRDDEDHSVPLPAAHS